MKKLNLISSRTHALVSLVEELRSEQNVIKETLAQIQGSSSNNGINYCIRRKWPMSSFVDVNNFEKEINEDRDKFDQFVSTC